MYFLMRLQRLDFFMYFFHSGFGYLFFNERLFLCTVTCHVRHVTLMQRSVRALSLGISVLLNLENLLSLTAQSHDTCVLTMCEGKEIINSDKFRSFHVPPPNTVKYLISCM